MDEKKICSPKTTIDELARKLVANHLHLSLRGQELRKKNYNLKDFLENEIDPDFLRERTIVAVVGAGSSSAAGLPTADEAIVELRGFMNIPDELVRYQLDRLVSTFRLKKEEFETQLRAFSRLNGQKVRDDLQKMYSARYVPLLWYEILSHMLKHRFLDVIINFNFDELLDQSIDDELGQGEYYKIISDGDCPDSLLNLNIMNNRADLPVYIKPHGTASHKSTMRFTRDDYHGLPTDIRRVMENLIINMKRPITLIVIGFGMKSFEFNDIINTARTASTPLEIYYFKRGDLQPEPQLYKYESRPIKLTATYGFKESFLDLWNSIESYFKPLYKPRGIQRHRLISEIFGNQRAENRIEENERTPYLEDRTKIELIITIAKSKGLLNCGELDGDRCGRYFDLYRRDSYIGKVNKRSLYSFCESLDFKAAEYGHEVLKWENQTSELHENGGDTLLLKDEEFQRWIDMNTPDLVRCFMKYNVSKADSNIEGKSFEIFAKEYLNHIFKEDENTEILTCPQKLHHKIFRNPETLTTNTALKWNTHDLLTGDWDTLLIIAETGAWLTAPDIRNLIKERRKAYLLVIVADRSKSDLLEDTFRDIRSKADGNIDLRHKVQWLNWWEHNKHMTITLKNYKPISSIYFTRRLRSNEISPVRLGGKDSQALLNVFCAYWEKANNNKDRIVNYEKVQNTENYLKTLCKLLPESGRHIGAVIGKGLT